MNDLLLTTITSLGFDVDGAYHLEPDVINSVRVLIKYLLNDDKNCIVRQQIGQSNVWEKDLLPILTLHADNNELFLVIVRLMLNLSMPTKKIFQEKYGNEEFPKDAEFQYNYENVQRHLYQYKESFTDCPVWETLKHKLKLLLAKSWEDREVDDSHTIERILYLCRNILHIPPNAEDQNRAPGEDTVHDKVSKVLVDSGFGQVITFISSNEDCIQYRPHVMEIIAHLLREQDPKTLAVAQTESEKTSIIAELELDAQKEKMENKLKSINSRSRHSRFGGTFAVMNQTGKNIITKKLVKTVEEVTRDRVKSRHKIRSKKSKGSELYKNRLSSKQVRKSLQSFCDQFLDYGYNNSMNGARNLILRSDNSLEDNDEVFYFHNMKVFMSYTMARPIWSFSQKVAYVSETLSIPTISFIERSIHKFCENISSDKTRQSQWTTKLNYSIRAFQQVIRTILEMQKSGDENLMQSAKQIKEQILYTPEYRELIPQLLKKFNPTYQTKNYLRDVFLTQHVLLKMLDGASEIVIRAKKRTIKRVKKKKNLDKPEKAEPLREDGLREGAWNDLREEVDEVVNTNANMDDTMSYNLLDPTSEPVHALGAIQLALHGRSRVRNVTAAELSVRLLRAAQQLWPENEEFGTFENEKETLEVLCKEKLPDDAYQNESSDEEEVDELMDEEEGNDYEDVHEAVIDVREIIEHYSNPDVLQKAGLLLREYKFNTPEVNHALCKLLHRIVFQLDRPAMCYSATLFRTFQMVNEEKLELKTNPTVREIWKLGKFILNKFFENMQKNQKLPIELLLWTTSGDWKSIQDGDYANNFFKRSGLWDEELDDELRQLAKESETFNQRNPDTPQELVAYIEEQFTDDSKSSAQIRRRCIKLGLVQKQTLQRSSAVVWTEHMSNSLSTIFKEFGNDHHDIISKIQDHDIDVSRHNIINKLLELGLILDRSEVSKKSRTRTKDPESAQAQPEVVNKAFQYENIPIEDLEILLGRMKWNDNVENAIKWLRDELEDEITDRQDSPETEWVERILVAQNEMVAKYLEKSNFRSILRSAQFQYPNHEQVYWRVGTNISLNELEFTSATLNEFEPKSDMYGSDVDTEPEPEQPPQRRPSRYSESSDEIDLFKSTLNTSSPPKRKKLTKRISKIPPPQSSDSDDPNLSQKLRVKKLSLEDVTALIDDNGQTDKVDLMSENEDEPVEIQPGNDNTGEQIDEDDSDDEIKIVKKRRRQILESDSD